VVTDIGNVLGRIPGGRIPAAFVEDGDTADPIVNYGHRNDAAEANPVNRYINAAGVADQAGGCRYESEDFPGHTALPDCLPGDSYDIDVSFRGEIQRDGTPIQSKQWTAIRRAGWTP
jgi:hypothetical protein